MSEQEIDVGQMSDEDKFFGVRTKIGGDQEEVFEEAVEAEPEGELTDDELSGYSKRVQKGLTSLNTTPMRRGVKKIAHWQSGTKLIVSPSR